MVRSCLEAMPTSFASPRINMSKNSCIDETNRKEREERKDFYFLALFASFAVKKGRIENGDTKANCLVRAESWSPRCGFSCDTFGDCCACAGSRVSLCAQIHTLYVSAQHRRPSAGLQCNARRRND